MNREVLSWRLFVVGCGLGIVTLLGVGLGWTWNIATFILALICLFVPLWLMAPKMLQQNREHEDARN